MSEAKPQGNLSMGFYLIQEVETRRSGCENWGVSEWVSRWVGKTLTAMTGENIMMNATRITNMQFSLCTHVLPQALPPTPIYMGYAGEINTTPSEMVLFLPELKSPLQVGFSRPQTF